MISNRCARKSLVTNCNSIISKNCLRFLVDSNEALFKLLHMDPLVERERSRPANKSSKYNQIYK